MSDGAAEDTAREAGQPGGMTVGQDGTARSVALAAAPAPALRTGAVLGVLAVQAALLSTMGQPLVCACGSVSLWAADPSGPETSQQLSDWYSLSHLIHGVAFYALLRWLAPAAPVGLRLAVALGLEAGWELLENTPFIIDRYRQTALANGYVGDSILNSLGDSLAAATGFLLARALPAWTSLVLVLFLEALAAWAIRDNLTLNVIALVHPVAAIEQWQQGG